MRPGRLPEDHPLEIQARSRLQEKTVPESQQVQPQPKRPTGQLLNKPASSYKPLPGRWE